MVRAGEVLFVLFFKGWLVQLVKTDVLHSLCGFQRLSWPTGLDLGRRHKM